MPPKTHGSVIGLIDGFLKEAQAGDLEKEAKNLDLAGDAKSTHASTGVDDGTKPATEGSRSSENEADVKKDVPNSINNPDTENTDAKGNEGATVNGDQGTVTMDADSGLKGNVDAPKKNHSQSMSDSGPGDNTFSGPANKAAAAGALVGEANGLLADVAMLAGVTPPATAAVEGEDGAAAKTAADDGSDVFAKAAEAYPEDVEAGYTAAALLAQQMGFTKGAAEAPSNEAQMVDGILKAASSDAENYVDFLSGFAETMEKGAMPMGADPAALAALAGEGDAGGEMGEEEMAAGAGGEDAGAGLEGLGGAEEGMGEEEMLAAGPEGVEGGEGGGDELEAIAEILAEAGIEPEQLIEAIEQQGGGDAGGEEEMVEGAPEAM